jgi:hypothetical protein
MKSLFKILLLSSFSIFFLAACGTGGSESPEDVMAKLKQNMTEIKSADFSGDIGIMGSSEGETVDFDVDAALKFDRNDDENRKMEIGLKTNGTMSAVEKTVDANVDFEFKSVGDEYYLRLSQFDSTDESMEQLKPLLASYMGKWLRISPDFIPEDLRGLQEKDAETLAREQQLKDLFIETKLFSVVKEYGIETLDGKKVYHYGVELTEKGIQDYIRGSALIEGREVTEEDIAEASKVATYLKGAELWVGTEDYYPYKFTVKIDSEALAPEAADEDADMEITVMLKGSGYNQSISIQAPADSQEFNPLELMMTYSMMNMAGSTDMEGMTDEEKAALMEMMEGDDMMEGAAMDPADSMEGDTDEMILEDYSGPEGE